MKFDHIKINPLQIYKLGWANIRHTLCLCHSDEGGIYAAI